MLRFLDLENMYAEADKALGGILPGGGTAGPLSGPARQVLNAVPILDEIHPASKNYYRDKVEADRQRGERLATEARDSVQNINVYDGVDSQEIQTYNTADEQRTEATLRGVVMSDQGTPLSTREEGQSDRDFYLRNRNLREGEDAYESAEHIRDITIWNENNRLREVAGEREQSTTQGVSWVDSINGSAGMSTADGPESGSLGCVYGVNKVIKNAGLEVPWRDPATGEESVYIPFVTNWITSNGGSQVNTEQAKPGDIVVAMSGGHMGILTDKVDGNGYPIVLSNSSSRASMSWEFPLSNEMQVYRVPQLQR